MAMISRLTAIIQRLAKTKRYTYLAVALIAVGLIVVATKYTIHSMRTAPDTQARYNVSPEQDNATQQINYAGTGNGEDITADSSNKYMCVDYKGTLPDSPTVSNATAAVSDITGPIANLFQNGQFSDSTPTDTVEYKAAANAATDAADHLTAARDYAKSQVQLCYLVGILSSGISQMTTLATRLNEGVATNADLLAATRYATTLSALGLKPNKQ